MKQHDQKQMPSAVLIAVCIAVLCGGALLGIAVGNCGKAPAETQAAYPTRLETEPETEPLLPFGEMSLGDGLYVTRFFPYTGMYMEDGTNTPVTGVAACTVENRGTLPVQLLVFSLCAEQGLDYMFEVSTLLPGQRINVLDKNKTLYGEDDRGFSVYREQYALFDTMPALQPDKVQVFCSGSTIRLTNLTEEPFSTCRVFFKYKQNDTYIGGVTFSVKITDLAPGKSALLTPTHYNEDTCEILYVTYE